MKPFGSPVAFVLVGVLGFACGGKSVVTDANSADAGTGGTAQQGGSGGADGGTGGGISGTGGGTSGDGGGGGDGGSQPADLVVDSVNLQLSGAFDAFHADRLAKAPAAIAAQPSDVVCVQEAWGPETRSAILNATAGTFPYHAAFDFDLNTVPDDPTDQHGVIPEPPSTPPCSASMNGFDAVAQCIQDSCVDPAGDPSGKPVADLSQCLTSKCIGSLLPILSGTEEDKACYSCVFTQLSSYASPDEMRAACTQDPRARFAWNGNTGTFLLSRYPIQSSEAWVLPSTEFRVIVTRAEVKPPTGQAIDVYCTSLTQPGTGIARPYTGDYGDGAQSDDAWVNELALQAKRLVTVVQNSVSAQGRGGMLVGTLYAGPAYSTNHVDAAHVEAFNTVSAGFSLAVPQGYVPSCTLCNDNPIVSPPGSDPEPGGSWQSFVFMVGAPGWKANQASVFLKERVVDVKLPGGPGYQAPISMHYGFRSGFAVAQ